MTTETAVAQTPPMDAFDLSGRKGLKAAVGATLGMATGFGSLTMTSVFILPLGNEFGWSKSELSVCYTLAALGMAVGGMVWGRVSDRIDIRHLLLAGGLFTVLPLFAMSQASALWHLYAANLLLGLAGFGCLYAPLVSAAGEWFERRQGLVMGIVTAGGALGQGIMPFAAENLISTFGWREAFLGTGIAVLVVQVLVGMLVRRRYPVPAGPTTTGARFSLFATPRVAALGLAAFLCCTCMGVPLMHLASFVSMTSGSSSFGAACLLMAMMSGAIGRVCFGMVADRFGNLLGYASASLLQSSCIAVFPMLSSDTPLAVLSTVFGFGFAGNMTCLILCVREEAPPAQFGGAIGLVMFIAWAGMGAGGYLGGALFDRTGAYALAFVISAAFGAANLAVLALLTFTRKRGAGFRRAS